MTSVQQLKLDLDEVKRLTGLCNRPKVKEVLVKEQQRLEKEITELKFGQTPEASTQDGGKPTVKYETKKPQLATKVIKSYGWDQSEKFVKVYVTLPDVHTIPSSDVTLEFTNNSFVLTAKALKNANHQLARKNLIKDILPEGSHFKVKTDSVVVFCKKAEKHQWAYLTQTEQKTKESKTPKYDDKGDPGDSMMKMMKTMYDDGDDDMKRTIAKAWTEAQDKKQGAPGAPGGMGGMPGMPGGIPGMGGMGGMPGMPGMAGMPGMGGLNMPGMPGGMPGMGGMNIPGMPDMSGMNMGGM